MILRLCTQVLEYGLLPIALHVIPVVNHPVADRVMNTISRRLGICKCLFPDEEIKILHTSFRREMARTCRHGRSSSVLLRSWPSCSDCGRKHTDAR